jgi:dTDP-4-amino-4,6-dideoxygalactose transaminase
MALMTMLRAAGVQSGEVIVPSFTFPATPHAVRWCGAEPIFADIGADGSMSIDPDEVERKISPRTAAILGVDAYGIACDYSTLAWISTEGEFPNIRNAKRFTRLGNFAVAVGQLVR